MRTVVDWEVPTIQNTAQENSVGSGMIVAMMAQEKYVVH